MAIARDAQSTAKTSASGTVTATHVCTGANLLLLAYVVDSSGVNDNVTGVTYNGVAMTQLVKQQTYKKLYIYGLVAPATGSNSLIASRTNTTGDFVVIGSSYTGVSQTSLPDATGSNSLGSTGSIGTSVTTVANNCWAFLGVDNGGSATITASTNATLVATQATDITSAFDNQTAGAITPAGAFSMTTTNGSSVDTNSVVVSFAPPGTNVQPSFLFNII